LGEQHIACSDKLKESNGGQEETRKNRKFIKKKKRREKGKEMWLAAR
jgi:hypothetical protein